MTRILKLLEEKGSNTNRLAKTLGGNRTNVFDAVRGVRKASIPLANRIATVLGVTPGEIFDENGMARRED